MSKRCLRHLLPLRIDHQLQVVLMLLRELVLEGVELLLQLEQVLELALG